MPFARFCLLTTVLCVLPLTALAQAQGQGQGQSAGKASSSSASAASAVPQPATTQTVTVVEPDMGALTPPKPPTAGKPRWSEFPQAPKNVPPLSAFAERVHKEEADKAALEAIGASIVWERFQPDTIAATANAQLDPSKFKPIDPEMTPDQTEALAQSLRAQDTPPPVAQ